MKLLALIGAGAMIVGAGLSAPADAQYRHGYHGYHGGRYHGGYRGGYRGGYYRHGYHGGGYRYRHRGFRPYHHRYRY